MDGAVLAEPRAERVRAADVEEGRACVVRTSGDVTCFADGTAAAVPGLDGATRVALGEAHACAIVGADRSVWCWGDNRRGQLGTGSLERRDRPVRVHGLSGVSAVAVGGSHACVLIDGGEVRCWGGFASPGADLPPPETADQVVEQAERPAPVVTRPRPVPGLDPATRRVVRIAAGPGDTCGVLTDGRVACWPGFVGDQTAVEVMPWPVDAVDVAMGAWGRCAVREGGAVVCWDHAAGAGRIVAPTAVRGLEQVEQVAVGAAGACALDASGRVRCWSGDGQLATLGFPGDSR